MTDIFVFDTNSLISAAILPNSITARAFWRAIEIGYLVISDKTFSEFETVISREKFEKYLPDISEKHDFIKNVTRSSLIIKPKISVTVCRNPKDDKFLELAVAAKASCIITESPLAPKGGMFTAV